MNSGYQFLSIVIGYQQVINGYQGLSNIFNCYLYVINSYKWLSMVVNGYWLSASY